MTPLLRVVPPELCRRDEDDPYTSEVRRVASIAGEKAVYLDAVGSPRRQRRIAPLGEQYARHIYEEAVASGLAFAPVYPFGRRDLAGVVRAFASDALGAAVLVSEGSALIRGARPLRDELRDEVRSLGIGPAHLDLVVDLGYLAWSVDDVSSVVSLVLETVAAAPWRSVTLAATSVPDSVAGEVPDDSLNGIERRERPLFDAVQAAIDIALRFGDYAVQYRVPPRPGAAPKMRASIRYTAGDFMLVSRGGTPIGSLAHDDVPDEYRGVATRLRFHPSFIGSECCWGDRYIEELSDGRVIARGQHQMRAVSTCTT